MKLHQPARATQLLHTKPGDPSSTSVRLEFSAVQPDEETRSTPNSLSPTPELANGNGVHHLSANGNGHSSASPGTPKTIDIPCDSIVIAAGCWTPRVYRTLFPNAGRIPRITSLAGHSVVLKSKHWTPVRPDHLNQLFSNAINISAPSSPSSSSSSSSGSSGPATPEYNPGSLPGCHAVFTSDRAGYSPEVFSRLGGDIWLGGLNSSTIPLPALATQAEQSPEAVDMLTRTAKSLCGPDVDIIRTSLCFRPVAPTGRPVITRVHEADLGDGAKVPGGVFVATGHGPWGISLSLGTGYVVSEMVLGRPPSANVQVLSKWEAQGA